MHMNNCKTLVSGMRSIGLSMAEVMNSLICKNHRQYLVACIVSHKEIEDGTFYTVLTSAEHDFHTSLNGSVNVSKRYFRFKRFIFLMNYKDESGNDQHTEARLLDPSATILEKLKDNQQPEENGEEKLDVFDKGFLSCLKRDFVSKFGKEESYYIAMFSYFLPCEQTDHLCAKLITAFAELTQTDIILSYEMPYLTTNEQSCFQSLEHKNVTLIHPEDYLDVSVTDNRNAFSSFGYDCMRPYHRHEHGCYTMRAVRQSLPLNGCYCYPTPVIFPSPYNTVRFYPSDYGYDYIAHAPVSPFQETTYFRNTMSEQWRLPYQHRQQCWN